MFESFVIRVTPVPEIIVVNTVAMCVKMCCVTRTPDVSNIATTVCATASPNIVIFNIRNRNNNLQQE